MSCDGSLDMFSLGVALFAMLSGAALSLRCLLGHPSDVQTLGCGQNSGTAVEANIRPVYR